MNWKCVSSGCLGLLLAGHVPAGEPDAPVSIDTLVAQVVAAHPELRFHEAELEAARAEGRIVTAWSDPELSVSLGRKSVRDVASGISQSGRAWSVAVAQTFEWPGRMDLRRAIADRDFALAELSLQAYRAELAGRVRALAFSLLVAQQKAGAMREVADRLQALKETLVAREPGGITPMLEVRLVEGGHLGMDRRALESQLEVDRALIALNQLRGAAADAPLRVSRSATTYAPAPDLESMLALAMERNSAYRARLVELERQGFRATLARQEGRPSITLAPFFDEEEAGERERTVGLGVTVPLPLGGRRVAIGDAAAARLAQAEALLTVARLELERDVVTACHAYRSQREAMDAWPASTIAEFREAAALADEHYRLGAVPVGIYIELQSTYLDALEDYCLLEQGLLEAGVKLEALTAGAWRAMEVAP